MAALTRPAANSRPAAVEWGVAARPRPGGTESGDCHVVQPFASGILFAVIDGLGHGEPAAAAARQAAAVIAEHAGDPVCRLVERCHQALAATRGVVMSLASVDTRDLGVSWIGIGNVEAVLVRGGEAARPAQEHLLLRAGIVGQKLPPLRAARVTARPRDTLLMATDGIRGGFDAALPRSQSPRRAAEAILARDGRATDDALVVVARLHGAAG
jgi:negative regulator of sigma-B (phosphoserine phosphatase)